MTALQHNNLRFYTLRITDTPEEAEAMAQAFEDKFDNLNEVDQGIIEYKIEMDGWEEALNSIDDCWEYSEHID